MNRNITVLLVASVFWSSNLAAEEIHVGARNGDVKTVMALLESGVPVDLPSTKDTSNVGVTPLWVAAKWNQLEVAQILLNAGADPTLLPSDKRIGDTPITVAAKWGRIEMVALFLDHGADPNKLAHGGTPLHRARGMGNDKIAHMLLAAGAKPSISQPSIEHLLAEGDIDRGRRLSRTCRVCHVDPEQRDSVDSKLPQLWGIVGRAKASQPAIKYSEALKNFGGTWTFDELNSFLALPGALIPGTNMGNIDLIDKLQERVDIIAYLRTLSDYPMPLP